MTQLLVIGFLKAIREKGLSKNIVVKIKWLGNFAAFFVLCFCSLFPYCYDIDPAQITKGFEM